MAVPAMTARRRARVFRPDALEHGVHGAWREDDATPALARQLRCDAPRPQSGEAEGEGGDALLDPRRRLVRHVRWPPLPWPEGIQTPLADCRQAPVAGRPVAVELPAGLADAHLLAW